MVEASTISAKVMLCNKLRDKALLCLEELTAETESCVLEERVPQMFSRCSLCILYVKR